MTIRRSAALGTLAAVALATVGYLGGVKELVAAGAVGVSMVIVDALMLVAVPLPSQVTRSVGALRTSAGQPVDVMVTATFRRWRPRRAFRISERLDGSDLAPFTIEVGSGPGPTSTAYRVTPVRRGLVNIGPLRMASIPVLGLVDRRRRTPEVHSLIVHPGIVGLSPLVPLVGSAQRRAGHPMVARPEPDIDPGPLRTYVLGDDVRRIHWPSSARSNELVVRTDDPPIDAVCVIMVDPRSCGDVDGTERAISLAASILTAQFHGRITTHLVVVGANTMIDASDERGLTAALDALAFVECDEDADIDAAIAMSVREPRSVIVASASDDIRRRVSDSMVHRASEVTVAYVGQHPDAVRPRGGNAARIEVVAVRDDVSEWDHLMRRRRAEPHSSVAGARR